MPILDQMERFYVQRLGFLVSDRYPDRGVFLRWAPEGGHHDLFVLQTPASKPGVNHPSSRTGSISRMISRISPDLRHESIKVRRSFIARFSAAPWQGAARKIGSVPVCPCFSHLASMPRVAQPVMRRSNTANTSYIKIAITLMTIRPAKTSGMRICEPADIIR